MFTLDRHKTRQDNPFIKKKMLIQFDRTLHSFELTHLTHNFNQMWSSTLVH